VEWKASYTLPSRPSAIDHAESDDETEHGLPWHTYPVPNAGYVLSGDQTCMIEQAAQPIPTMLVKASRNPLMPNTAAKQVQMVRSCCSPTPAYPEHRRKIPAKGEKPEY
jgi:hypothetical protein